ncbi:MAG TPA: type 1 glutamine amidotransferase domain-containing protein [Stellaceae bacterium]
MRVLFIISGSDTAFCLSEVTHPYWHLTERDVEVDFASPDGGKVVYDPYSDPYFEHSTEPNDLVSKGFLADKALVAKLGATLKLKNVDLTRYDAVHIAGGRGATFDLYPNEDVARVLEHFRANGKVVGAICHGAIALGNIPDRVRGHRTTGYTLEGDQELRRLFGGSFIIAHFPQTVLEEAGSVYSRVAPNDPYVVRDGKLVTGQNQQSASEYALVLLHAMTGQTQCRLAKLPRLLSRLSRCPTYQLDMNVGLRSWRPMSWNPLVNHWPALVQCLVLALPLLLFAGPVVCAAEQAGTTVVLQLPPSMPPDALPALITQLVAKGARPLA